MPATACRRAYDHRMRDLVCEERDPGLFHHLGVPRSTAVSCIRRGLRPAVSAEVLSLDHAELQAEVLAVRRRIRFLLAIIRLACQLLAEAGKHLPAGSHATSVVADSGVENVNQEVNALFESGPLRRVLAQVEVSFSNSMIEAWRRSLKHGWLYLHQLGTFAALEKLIAFYVEQHNSVVPPDEMHFGRGDLVPLELAAGHARARAARLESNRERPCAACRPPVRAVRDPSGLPDPSANSRLLHLHDRMSGMS